MPQGARRGPEPGRRQGAWRTAPRGPKTLPSRMPASLAEPQGRQERILQHTLEQVVDLAPTVQILDAPVPQPVEQLADVLKRTDECEFWKEEERVQREEEEKRWRS